MPCSFLFVYPFFSGDAPALPLIIVTNVCLFVLFFIFNWLLNVLSRFTSIVWFFSTCFAKNQINWLQVQNVLGFKSRVAPWENLLNVSYQLRPTSHINPNAMLIKAILIVVYCELSICWLIGLPKAYYWK